MHFQATVCGEANDTVHAATTRIVIALTDSNTGNLRAVTLARTRHALFKVKLFGAHFKGLWHIGTGKRNLPCATHIAILRRIDLTNFQAIDAEFLGRFVEDWRDNRGNLILAWSTLRATVSGITTDRRAAETNCFGLIKNRDTVGC